MVKSTKISDQGKVINKEMSLLMKSFGWHLRLNGHEFEQTMGASEGQGSRVRSRPQDVTASTRPTWAAAPPFQ